MRALLLFYYFPPSGGPGVQRGLKLCAHLPQFGVQPALVTAADRAFAAREAYAGDESLLDEVPHGLRIARAGGEERTGLRRCLQSARLLRLAQHKWPARFFERQASWFGPAQKAGLREIEQFCPDVLLTSSQPYVTHLVGRALKAQTGVAWVADFRDPWTYSWGRTFVSRRAFEWEYAREQEVLRAADVVVMNTPGSRRELLADRPWLAPSKVHVVRNGYDVDDFDVQPADRPQNAVLIVHSGSFRGKPASARRTGLRAWVDARTYEPVPYDLSTHSLETLLRALALLRDRNRGPQVVVRLVGPLSAAWKQRAQDLGVADSLEVLGYRPHREALSHLLAADLLYLPTITRRDGRPVSNVPAKTYEYLGSGRPMVVLAEDGDVADTCSGRERVTIVPPRDVDALADVIAALEPGPASGVGVDPPDAHPFRRRALAGEMAAALRQARDTVLARPS
jgi:glycosyltransferase involved in cell wall biosynthesis